MLELQPQEPSPTGARNPQSLKAIIPGGKNQEIDGIKEEAPFAKDFVYQN